MADRSFICVVAALMACFWAATQGWVAGLPSQGVNPPLSRPSRRTSRNQIMYPEFYADIFNRSCAITEFEEHYYEK